MTYIFNPERIAYWFFRLNGCFILDNFLVHHPQRDFGGTEIDILATRFPYRRELASSPLPSAQPMQDHDFFENENGLINIYFVEVKRSLMRINDSWLKPEKQNMEYLLEAIGAIQKEKINEVANKLYLEHSYTDDRYCVRYVAVGDAPANELPTIITTLSWTEILSFIYHRLKMYRSVKSQHNQWDSTGKQLYQQMLKSSGPDGEKHFVAQVTAQMKP